MKQIQTLSMRMIVTALGAGLGLGFGPGAVDVAHSQTLVPVPFVTSFAGLAPGSGATACPTSIQIPTSRGVYVGDGCLPSQASLSAPTATAVDPYNNIYIADYSDHLLRVVYQGNAALAVAIVAANPQVANLVPQPGNIYTLAGGLTASLSQTGTPKAYYCSTKGTGATAIASNGDGCPGSDAYVTPRGIAVDPNGNVFFANLAGAEGMRVFYVGGAAVAKLITTLNTTVTTPLVGAVYSITGSSTAGYSGDGAVPPATARTAAFENVRSVAIDANGNLFISDGNSAGSTTNNDVRVIYVGGTIPAIKNPSGTTTPLYGEIYTIAGATASAAACPATPTFSGDGGPSNQAALNSPYSIFFDPSGNLYLADSCNGRLRVIVNSTAGTIPNVTNPVVGNIYTVAGGGTLTGAAASGVPATQLSITLMQAAGIDASGNLYVADNTNKYIWQINAKTGIAVLIGGLGPVAGSSPVTGVLAAPAGSHCAGTAGPKSLDTEGDGCPALQAAISPNLALTFDSKNRMYSVENGNNYIRQYSYGNLFPATAVGSVAAQPLAFYTQAATTLTSEAFTLQGVATAEFADAGGTTCALNTAIAANTVCVFNVQFAPMQAGLRSGTTHLAGSNNASVLLNLAGDGLAAEASIDPGTQKLLANGTAAQGVATDLLGNIYVSDGTANQVVQLPPGGGASSVLITGLKQPHQIAIDNAGNVYAADSGNNRIAMVGPSGGAVSSLGTGLSAPQGVAVDALGDVFISDTGNNRVVELLAGGGQQVATISGLSGPTQLAIDASRDIFVADTGNQRVVELPANNNQTVVSLGTAVTPVGVAVDAAGDIYVVDSASEQVLELAAGKATAAPLVSSLKAAAGLALDTNASVYAADTLAPGVVFLNRALGAISFPLTNVGQSSSESISVSDSGNATLNFSTTPVTTASGNFSASAAQSNGCAQGTPVASGANCLLNALFDPPDRGTSSQTISFATTAANNGSIGATLSGTGAQLFPTSTAVAVTSPTGTIAFGQQVVVTVTVTPSSTTSTPTGTMTISIDGTARAAQPYGAGTYTVSLNLPVGTHVVSATFSGDTVFASSGGTNSFTVAKAATTAALTITLSPPGGSPTFTFAASVASPTASGESGSISFYSGTTLLNTTAVGTSGTATYISSSLAFPSGSFTAVYSGDGNFSASTSPIVSPSPDFAITSSTSTLATAQGGTISASVTITPLFGEIGTLTPSCSGLPANSVCRFQPTTITLDGSTPVGVAILIYTDVSSTIARVDAYPSSPMALALCGPWVFGSLLLLRRRSKRTVKAGLFAVCLFGSMLAAASLTGCSSVSSITPVTPAGTQNITVTFTGTGGTATTHAVTFSMTVNANN